MLTAVRLLALAVVAFAAAADAPPPAETPSAGAGAALATDDDIRAAFVGKAACPPEPLPVGVGPHEFRVDGTYVRARDIVSAHGRYTIDGGKICITLVGSGQPDFCLAVLKDAGGYSFRLDDSATQASRHAPVRVTPCDPR